MQYYFFPPVCPLTPWDSFLVVIVKANHSKRYFFTINGSPDLDWHPQAGPELLAESCSWKLYNHGITDSFWLENTFQIIESNHDLTVLPSTEPGPSICVIHHQPWIFAAAWWLLQILPDVPSPLLAVDSVFQCPERVLSTCGCLVVLGFSSQAYVLHLSWGRMLMFSRKINWFVSLSKAVNYIVVIYILWFVLLSHAAKCGAFWIYYYLWF